MLNSCMVNAKVDGLIVVLVMVHGVESWHVCVLACLCIWGLRGSFCLAVYNHIHTLCGFCFLAGGRTRMPLVLPGW